MPDETDTMFSSAAPRFAAPETLVNVLRGGIVESRHYGHIAVVDSRGTLIANVGDPTRLTFLRSVAKPFQAVPVITSGAAGIYGFSPAELAIACGSHAGRDEQTHTVAGMLTKMNLCRSSLRCGVHYPLDTSTADKLKIQGTPANELHNNCSGKHAGMLAVASSLGAPIGSYEYPTHPVQQKILACMEEFSGIPMTDMEFGTDGCGAPIFALPLQNIALAYARFVDPDGCVSDSSAGAARTLGSAMLECPEMVAGPGLLDTAIMRQSRGQIISKGGAEAVYAAAVRPSPRWPHGLGIALKIEDGCCQRARTPAVLSLLEQLDLIPPASLAVLRSQFPGTIQNHAGSEVGNVTAGYRLKLAETR